MLHVLGILNTKSMLNRCIGNMCLFFHKKGNLISRHISVSLIISSDDGCVILERENTGYGFLRDLSAPPSITSIYLVWDWELSLWAIILENMLMFEGIFYFFLIHLLAIHTFLYLQRTPQFIKTNPQIC